MTGKSGTSRTTSSKKVRKICDKIHLWREIFCVNLTQLSEKFSSSSSSSSILSVASTLEL